MKLIRTDAAKRTQRELGRAIREACSYGEQPDDLTMEVSTAMRASYDAWRFAGWLAMWRNSHAGLIRSRQRDVMATLAIIIFD